jgi:molecular chaperone DnaK
MKAEAEKYAEEDNRKKEEIEKLNKADSLIFQTERQLKEYGDKISADKKVIIETALSELKTAFESKTIGVLDDAMEKLQTAFQSASQEMYSQPGTENTQSPNDEVSDVDYEEVK